MFYILPLGNPGEKYADTRHNVGWLALDYVTHQWRLPGLIESKAESGRVTDGPVKGSQVRVLYPGTFMNNSGMAAVKFVPKNEVQNLIVVHDDVDLPFGEVKVVNNRGSGGNNGVSSIIKELGTKNFVRVRIGIAPTSFWTGKVKRPAGGGPLERFVLKSFGKTEQKHLDEVFTKVQQSLELIMEKGAEAAMNQFN